MRFISHFTLIFFLLITIPASAQVQLGVLAGLNSTGFSGDDPPKGDFSSDLGYNVGVSADFHIYDDIVLIIRPQYSLRTTNIQFDVKYQYEKYDSLTAGIEYFELPLYVKILSENRLSYVSNILETK